LCYPHFILRILIFLMWQWYTYRNYFIVFIQPKKQVEMISHLSSTLV